MKPFPTLLPAALIAGLVLLAPLAGSAGAAQSAARTRASAHAQRAGSREQARRRRAARRARRRDRDRAAKVAKAAALAEVLQSPCTGAALMPEPGNLAIVQAATLCLVNRERARRGEGPLRPEGDLEAAAASHGAEMIAQGYFAHVAPDGETPLQRIRSTGYIPPHDEYVIGENLAWGTLYLATPESVVAAWMASPDHRANILEGAYRQTGISVLPAVPGSLAQGQAGALYSQEFGVVG